MIKVEIGAEHEGAVVEQIVAHPEVGHRRAGLARLERRMRIDAARGRVEPRIGRSVNADVFVVVRNVLHQPLDCVVRVGGFVDV